MSTFTIIIQHSVEVLATAISQVKEIKYTDWKGTMKNVYLQMIIYRKSEGIYLKTPLISEISKTVGNKVNTKINHNSM